MLGGDIVVITSVILVGYSFLQYRCFHLHGRRWPETLAVVVFQLKIVGKVTQVNSTNNIHPKTTK